ncbi:hypothetical protein [Streptomyces sp. NBC_01373]|uniref:hypothetical protein n=1 Tax=Streptomyces sp. NBC_01373 TaxID=2903843 RepID=UPI00225220D5|nr:hypothetical protein [Streptomyces sp. NBC_01373]MCX4699540.1 hypothetical protein [Streptomyces sp. NBC_01373]
MPSSYTGAEKRRIAWLAIKAGKQSIAGDRNTDTIAPKVKREMDRIEERAADRGEREVQALQRKLSAARDAAATAKATMRTSSGKDRATARTQMHEQEAAARRVERELRRYQ